MIVASNIAMPSGAKPLFSDVAVKFGGGNRYGLIGANGCGRTRSYRGKRVLDVVLQGHAEMWAAIAGKRGRPRRR